MDIDIVRVGGLGSGVTVEGGWDREVRVGGVGKVGVGGVGDGKVGVGGVGDGGVGVGGGWGRKNWGRGSY